MIMEVVLKVCRFDPARDTSPFFEEFAVGVRENQTVLDALLLAWQQEPSLSFRRSCRSAICGSCAVSINQEPALACQTLIGEAMKNGGPLTVEPLPYFRQLRDLVVDLEPMIESLKVTVPWLIIREDYDGLMSPEVARKLEDPAQCILCGICSAAMGETEVNKPVGVVKTLRLAQDPRDALGMHRLRLMQIPPEVLKLFIRRLPEKCPKGIKIADVAQGI